MSCFEKMDGMGHEELIFCRMREAGLRAVIAIHDTTLGPALGGTRMWPYASENEAITDALRLARGMTYKAAAAGLNMGGGKAVILGDPKVDKSEALFRAFGRFIETLNGRFITGEDVGLDVNDVEYMYMETRYVTGLSRAHGGGGDPAPITAFGVLQGIRACIEARLNTTDLKKVSVAVQGLGNVGFHLAKLLKNEGARVAATDIDLEKARFAKSTLDIEIVQPEEIYDVTTDIFAPCALGAIVNDRTLDRMKFKIIAGAANNQLEEDRHGRELHHRNILYAPDYVINAGGMVNVFVELEGYDRERAMRMSRAIYYNLRKVFQIAQRDNISTNLAADKLVEERIAMMHRLKGIHTGHSQSRFHWEHRSGSAR
ncbi:MAG: Glu/Leu/Phe/Val dehydrogenase dimerization domain-containing protein [Terriglobia bacterium]